MPANTSAAPNRLIHEKSPYLLQHAHNPVDWYPWGQEAFSKAKNEDKPIFLSVGYSTCHWCHVMEEECFSDPDIAEALNRDFVSIKVDREERPDVDAVYMNACLAAYGTGGWPLNAFVTPDQAPFFLATYVPKHSSQRATGLLELSETIAQLWRDDREVLIERASLFTNFLRENTNPMPQGAKPTLAICKEAVSHFSQSFDPDFGGFGMPPKFPMPHQVLFLLNYYVKNRDQGALMMADKTLVSMYRGGIFDHIGGGFARYATDRIWLVPHFEKTLYDNALLLYAYLQAYELTELKDHLHVASKTKDYVLSELTDRQGGFYCGEDADTNGKEGEFYLLTPHDVDFALGKEKAEEFCAYFDITQSGNFEGKNIPNLLKDAITRPSDIDAMCDIMARYRKNRHELGTDRKILTSWNALMISALAKAYRTLKDEAALNAAKQAQRFIEENMWKCGRLMHRHIDGETAHEGLLEDYAFYVWALMELYEATNDMNYLSVAEYTAGLMIRLFYDEEHSGYFLYAGDVEELIARPKEIYEGAVPCGNSVAALALVLLARHTQNEEWQKAAREQLTFLASTVKEPYTGHSFALFAMMEDIR